MSNYFLNLDQTEFEELEGSLNAICEENKEYPGNALFFLTNALKSSGNLIALCDEIIATNKFKEDHNFICGCSLHFTLSNEVLKKNMLPSKEEELKRISPLIKRAYTLLDSLIDKDISKIKVNLKIQKAIYTSLERIIRDTLIEEKKLELYKLIDPQNYSKLTRIVLNSGKFSNETITFFLETFVYTQSN